MRKFIDSQVKSKGERSAERDAARQAKIERLATRDAEKAELERQDGYGGSYGMSRYQSGETVMPASGADFDSTPHHRHFSDRRLANPAPLGLFAFSFSTFLLGLINLGTQGVTQTTALVGPFLMYSGIMMSITAIFELIAGNTFGATAFGTFAGFYLSLGAIFLTSFGTFALFDAEPLLLFKFFGLFFATWLIPFGIFCILTIRSTWTLWLQFIFLFISLAISTAQYLKDDDPTLQKAAGAILIVVSFLGYLNGAAGLMQKETVFFQPPVLPLPWASHGMIANVKGPNHPDNHPDNLRTPVTRQYTGQTSRSQPHYDTEPPTLHSQQEYQSEYIEPQVVTRTPAPRQFPTSSEIAPPLGAEDASYKMA